MRYLVRGRVGAQDISLDIPASFDRDCVELVGGGRRARWRPCLLEAHFLKLLEPSRCRDVAQTEVRHLSTARLVRRLQCRDRLIQCWKVRLENDVCDAVEVLLVIQCSSRTNEHASQTKERVGARERSGNGLVRHLRNCEWTAVA